MKMFIASIVFAANWLILTSGVLSQVGNPNDFPWEWRTDTATSLIDLSEVMIVLPRGVFPPLIHAKFIEMEAGTAGFYPAEPVISVEIDGKAKAYPLSILTAHQISNDSLGNIPLLVTYCPLCNSATVYDRRLRHNNKQFLLDFNVSGMLRYSNMVMFDRQTETWWQQINGKALTGTLAGARLDQVPSMIIPVAEFFKRYPDGKILSKDTGYEELKDFYGINPYQGYDDITKKPYPHYFDSSLEDLRLPPMERVVNIESKGAYMIYPYSVIVRAGIINDTFNGKDIVIFHLPGMISVLDSMDIADSKDIGSATAFNAYFEGAKLVFEKKGDYFHDLQSGSQWDITGRCLAGRFKGKQLKPEVHGNPFSFVWLAFYPGSQIFHP